MNERIEKLTREVLAGNAYPTIVPTEYDNLFMDREGFIYVCTTHVDENELDSGAADPAAIAAAQQPKAYRFADENGHPASYILDYKHAGNVQ